MTLEQTIAWAISPMGMAIIGGTIAILAVAEMLLLMTLFRSIGRRSSREDRER